MGKVYPAPSSAAIGGGVVHLFGDTEASQLTDVLVIPAAAGSFSVAPIREVSPDALATVAVIV